METTAITDTYCAVKKTVPFYVCEREGQTLVFGASRDSNYADRYQKVKFIIPGKSPALVCKELGLSYVSATDEGIAANVLITEGLAGCYACYPPDSRWWAQEEIKEGFNTYPGNLIPPQHISLAFENASYDIREAIRKEVGDAGSLIYIPTLHNAKSIAEDCLKTIRRGRQIEGSAVSINVLSSKDIDVLKALAIDPPSDSIGMIEDAILLQKQKPRMDAYTTLCRAGAECQTNLEGSLSPLSAFLSEYNSQFGNARYKMQRVAWQEQMRAKEEQETLKREARNARRRLRYRERTQTTAPGMQ